MASTSHPAPRRVRLIALLHDRRGAISILTAASLTVLCGAIGLGLDTAVWYTNSNHLQTMAEASALSAGAMLSDSSETTASITAVAENSAMLNGFNSSTDTINVAFYNASGTPTPPPNATTVTVTATRTLPRMFSALFLASNPVVSESASASPAGGGGVTMPTGVCILVLDPSSSQTLLVNSNFNLDAPNCTIDVNSTSSTAAMFDSSMPNVAGVNIVGGDTLNGGSTVNNLRKGQTAVANPFVGAITAPTVGSCTVNSANYSGTTNLEPGTYCGNFNFNGSGTLNLAAGTYIFDGTTWNINSGWTVTGTGVTFYFVNSSSYVQFNSGVTVTLSAPSSGTYANVLIFEPDGLSTSSFAIDGTSSSGHALQGLVYLPSRNITFNSTYSGSADSFALVVHQLIFDSNSPNKWQVSPMTGSVGSSGSSTATLTN
jgi:Flp pilus assembly protein TadG